MAGRYALLVAAGDYDDEYFAQLRSPAQDVQSLAQVLEDPGLGGFEVQVLQNATESEIRVALDLLTAERDPDDFVLVYFSCHGLRDQSGDLFFATTPTRRALPSSTAVAASYVAGRLEQTLAGSRLLLLDCCYSGAFATGFAKGGDEPLGGEIRASRGYVCITACNEYELAYEGSELVLDEPVESAFTEKLIEGLRTGAADLDRDGWVETAELHGYVYQALGPERRQTPSYFAAGVQQKLLVARTPENPVPVVVTREVRRVRTPRFHAARFPPFRFAREDRATPTVLAEAMVQHPAEAAELFRSDDDRRALYDWIHVDVRDRTLERSIFRKASPDAAAAEAATAVFVATFAPHLPAMFRGRPVSENDLLRTAEAAIGGNDESARWIEDLQAHNVLRTLARHDCTDETHPCGLGAPCGILLELATRWDEALPKAQAASLNVACDKRLLVGQVLLVVADPKTWAATLAPTDDMPAWWVGLAARPSVGSLAVALLTQPAAHAERNQERVVEAARRRAKELSAAEEEQKRQRQEAHAAKWEKAWKADARRAGVRRKLRARRNRVLRRAVLVSFVPLIAALVGVAVSVRLWRGETAPPEIYHLDLVFVLIDLLLGLTLLAPVGGLFLIARRRRALGTVIAVVTAAAAVAAVPLVGQLWVVHAHGQYTDHAWESGLPVDDNYEPIPSDCGYTWDASLIVAMRDGAGDSCRRAEIYVNGRHTGTYDLPAGTTKMVGTPWWRLGFDNDEVAATVLMGPKNTWRLVGLRAAAPHRPLWQSRKALDSLDPELLHFARSGDTIVIEGRTKLYSIDLRTGEAVGDQRCPAGQKYAGMGIWTRDPISMICNGEHVRVSL
ncbi:caspase family protein [Actinoplanes friuliensis]|uniref:Caspase-related protein n=1 Tax=Actinoplanes friuliensis DSM 7358 TaxID=1246995 RepID=U5W2N8_9ACTN|nr:caspase family protein [Actinoplanes friuliensis]AGZ43493.1 caspase-related protein [Actinoplanes friuliensis DSM 7358]